MPDSCRNLAQSEWEPHRAKITRLYHTPGMTRNKIKKTMLEEDQFDASKSQYDTILKHWGLRKYLSAKEWCEVIRALDFQRARDPSYNLYDGGKVISELKIQRKRRLYCKTITPSHNLLDTGRLLLHLPEGITIKRCTMQNTEPASLQCDANSLPSFDGNHSLRSNEDEFTRLLSQNVVANRQTEMDVNCNNNNSSVDQLALTLTTFGDQVAFSPFGMNSDPDHRQGRLEYSNFPPLFLDAEVLDGNEISRINATTNSTFRFSSSPLSPTLNWNRTWEDPFFEFQATLQSQALLNPKNSMSIGISAFHDGHNQTIIAPCHLIGQSDDVQLAWILIGDAMSVSSQRGYPAKTQGLPSGEELLDSLYSLILTDTADEELFEPLDLINGDNFFTSSFVRLVFFSTVNNFAGLENIPTEAIMRFISQHDQMISSILHYLQSAPTIFSQALAENLFRAAIETCDLKVIELLMKTGLVDPNTIIFFDNRESRRTPIEKSATFRHIEITKCLLDAGADVNKTYEDEEYLERGALECAIRKWGEQSPLDLRLVKLLLDHGAVVRSDLVAAAIRWGDERLVAELMASFDPSHHRLCFSGHMLADAVQFLHNDMSFRIIQQVIHACRDTHSNQCIDSERELCGRVMAQAAKKANLELVKLLSTYGDQEGLDSALSAAVRSGSHTLIDFLIVNGANINGEAYSIDYINDPATTPLAEAIRAGDDELIARFEDSIALSQIDKSGRFEAAVHAASEVGNLSFLQKLFRKVPRPRAEILTGSLVAAIKAKNEKIALYLLENGANVGDASGALLEAIKIRSKRLVSVILECGVGITTHRVLQAAASWGDVSIVENLLFIGVDFNSSMVTTALIVAVQKRNMPLVKLLIKLGADLNLREGMSESPLSAAVSTQDSSLISYLLEHGADPADSEAITNSMSQDGETLNVLFRKFRERYPGGRVGFGGDILQYVLEKDSDLLLDLCLGAKLDVKDLACNEEYGLVNNVNSLGLVIRKYRGKRLDLVSKLLDAGGDINGLASRKSRPFNSEGSREDSCTIQTAFLEAIQTRSLPLVELLIRRGADVQMEARLGLKRTPLQKACEIGSYPIVDLLLRHQANIHAAPALKGGGDALQLAAKAGSVRIVNRLLKCGAKVNAPTAFVRGLSALEYAAKYGRVDMIQVLWNALDTVPTLEQCEDAILVAQENGNMACCLLLRNLFSSSQNFIGFDV